MPIRIGSNIDSLKVQRSLSAASGKLSHIFENLSTGQRINRASDDAAGLAIADSLRTNVRVYTQAIKNINDGSSFLAIAQGATEQLKNILGRCRELSTQASNGVYSDSQREALDREAQALAAEYGRIIDTTSFNDRRIFDASSGQLVIQAGYGTLGTLSASLAASDSRTNFISQLASVSTSGAEGDGVTQSTGISGDGRFIVFQSEASNLVPGDANGQMDIFVRDLQTGATSLVSASEAGEAGNSISTAASVSADGRYVVFTSMASNLAAGDGNGTSDIFVKDIQTGTVTLVSSAGDTQADGGSDGASISADGRYVTFYSSATNLVAGDTNGKIDVFQKDLLTGTINLVSVSSSGVQANDDSSHASVSADGRYVVFDTIASNIIAGDTNNRSDVFLRDTLTGTTSLISSSSSGTLGTSASSLGSISADGRLVVFQSSSSNLVNGDTNGTSDIFVKDIQTGETSLVSTSALGIQGDNSSLNPVINGDGSYIVFGSSAGNLTADGGTGYQLYAKDLRTGKISRLEIDDPDVFEPIAAISADGRYISSYSANGSSLAQGANGLYNSFTASNPLLEKDSISRLTWFNLRTQSEALNAQTWIDRYMSEIAGVQGQIGALQSRFQTAAANLASLSDNSAAAESRIRDADIARESAELVMTQILQQSSAAVLAQANQQPQIALSLLKNV